MIQIAVKGGHVALVDDEDADLASLKWHIRNTYACSSRGKDAMHRIIASRIGVLDGLVVDHINGKKLDNRRTNLRIVSNAVNLWNRLGPNKDCASGVLGVAFWNRKGGSGRWVAQITANGTKYHLGSYPTKSGAEAARLAAERKHWGVQPLRAEAHA